MSDVMFCPNFSEQFMTPILLPKRYCAHLNNENIFDLDYDWIRVFDLDYVHKSVLFHEISFTVKGVAKRLQNVLELLH